MEHSHKGWGHLLGMAAAMFAVMYVLMYAMVDVLGNALPNVNQFYMALLMTAAMVLLELAFMGQMYSSKLKIIAGSISIFVLLVSFGAIRTQYAVGDKEFLRSMIPHHGAAILMCENLRAQDPEIKALCAGIIASQQAEIDWMHEKLSTGQVNE